MCLEAGPQAKVLPLQGDEWMGTGGSEGSCGRDEGFILDRIGRSFNGIISNLGANEEVELRRAK